MGKKRIAVIIVALIILVAVIVGIKIFFNKDDGTRTAQISDDGTRTAQISDDGGSLFFNDTVHDTIERSKITKLSEKIENYIKDTYGYEVRVKNIQIVGSGGSRLAKQGISPAEIGSSVTVNFEENEYIDYVYGDTMWFFDLSNMPYMYVKMHDTEESTI